MEYVAFNNKLGGCFQHHSSCSLAENCMGARIIINKLFTKRIVMGPMQNQKLNLHATNSTDTVFKVLFSPSLPFPNSISIASNDHFIQIRPFSGCQIIHLPGILNRLRTLTQMKASFHLIYAQRTN